MVWEARLDGVCVLLVPRLTPLAAHECTEVQLLAESCPGSGSRTLGLSPLQGSRRFSACAAYALHRLDGVGAETTTFLWSNRPPSRVKFYGWLLTLSRVHTWDVLLCMTILTAEEAGCSCCEAVLETADHLTSGCPFAVQFWRCLGVSSKGASIRALHLFNIATAVGDVSPNAFVLLYCWRLLKRWNVVVFGDVSASLTATLKACRDDAVLWRARMKIEDHSHIDIWLGVLTST
ncbi:hypothetical protein ZWY2020_010255 [Hordeum vulgare]|nr:hypothetical protein ZWY2020_010255 [Hordeum vulgare]